MALLREAKRPRSAGARALAAFTRERLGTRLALPKSVSPKTRSFIRGGLVLVGAISLGGCYARAQVEPAYVETTYVPTHVHVYPSYHYEGRVVYLIHGRWYFHHPSGAWVYYRKEPPTLYRYRTTIRQAPPAPPRRAAEPYRAPPPREAPPAYYRDDGPSVPPPPPKKRKRHDDRDHRDDDGRDRDGRRHDDRDHHDHDDDRDRDRY